MSELYKITNINPVLIVPEHVHIAHVVEIYIYEYNTTYWFFHFRCVISV